MKFYINPLRLVSVLDPILTDIINTDPQPWNRWFGTFYIQSHELVLFLSLEDLDDSWLPDCALNQLFCGLVNEWHVICTQSWKLLPQRARNAVLWQKKTYIFQKGVPNQYSLKKVYAKQWKKNASHYLQQTETLNSCWCTLTLYSDCQLHARFFVQLSLIIFRKRNKISTFCICAHGFKIFLTAHEWKN